MSHTDEDVILEAIREAVEATIADLGIMAVRALFMFPSARVAEEVAEAA